MNISLSDIKESSCDIANWLSLVLITKKEEVNMKLINLQPKNFKFTII